MNNKENDIYKYFPHSQMRDEQKIITPMVYDLIRSIDFDGLILSAAPGIGKEACMTSQAILSLKQHLLDKVIFTIPTDIGKTNILKELASVKHGYRVIKILSKEVLCNWIKDLSDERIRAIESKKHAYRLCNLQGHKCKYKDQGCSYIEQKKEMTNADILICDYNYIISPFIKRMSNFEEIFQNNRILLFVNECHMLEPRAEMILTSTLKSTTINRAIEELDRYNEFKKEKEAIENMYESIKREVVVNLPKLRSQMNKNYEGIGEIVLQAYGMQEFLGPENLGERLVVIGEYISAQKFENKEGIISYVDMVGKFILRFYKRLPYKNSIVFFLKLRKDNTSYIGWIPLDVRGFLRNAIKDSNKFVLYSGTCNPKKLARSVGLGFERVLTPDPIELSYLVNRKDIILTKERFNDANLKDDDFHKRIKDDLDKLFSYMAKPIGIICTNNLYANLKLSSKFDILNEPENQEDVERWLKELLPLAQIIRFSPYGRLAQSIDIPGLRSIIFLGVPYQKFGPITDEKINKIARNYKGKCGNPRSLAMFVKIIEPAFEKIIQSIMRGLRNENDRLTVVYYDVNYKLNKPGLGSKNLVVCQTIEEVISHLKVDN